MASAESRGVDGHLSPGNTDEQHCDEGEWAHVDDGVSGEAAGVEGGVVAHADGGPAVGEFVEGDGDDDG